MNKAGPSLHGSGWVRAAAATTITARTHPSLETAGGGGRQDDGSSQDSIWASSRSPGNRWFCSKSEEAVLFIYWLYTWLFLPFWTWNLRLLSLSSQHGSRFIHTLQTCSWDQAVICQEVVNFHKVQFIHFYVLLVHPLRNHCLTKIYNLQRLSPVFFYRLYSFSFYCYDLFQGNFVYDVNEAGIEVLFFCIWISHCFSIIFWKLFFPTELPSHRYKKSIAHICTGCFWSLYSFICMSVLQLLSLSIHQ